MPENQTTTVSSASRTLHISRDKGVVIIGERINPTGRKKVLQALEASDFEIVRKDAREQTAAGAGLLDVNAGVPGADEPALLARMVEIVMEESDLPLSIDSNNPSALEAALKVYRGKALVNSVNGEERMLRAILPVVKEYSAAVIGLCIDDSGIPPTAEGRLRIAARIIERATGMGIPLSDIILDPLAMAMSADTGAGKVTLQTITLLREQFGVNLTMGASNVSFGLPDRKYLNSTFLAMAIYAGVSCPIANPLEPEVRMTALAADLALGRDEYAMRWIRDYRKRQKAAEASA